MSLLSIENISKSYSAHRALDGVDLNIPEQSIFGLLGPNGAGKTTLIRIVTKIIEPDSGNILLEGKEMDHQLIRKIGYLPEERGLYKKMKVGEQLVYLGRLKGMSNRDAITAAKEWIKRLELGEWWNKSIEDLSKGMAQKVQFIATVLHRPKLIILDEPFSGFDPVNADLIKDEILELRNQGTTVIFSTHRMESVEELCDHIALIHKSKKILDGKKTEVKETFREGLYDISFKGQITSNERFQVLSKTEVGDSYKAVIKDNETAGANALLKSLLTEVEIVSFAEKIPTINEIFISKVKD